MIKIAIINFDKEFLYTFEIFLNQKLSQNIKKEQLYTIFAQLLMKKNSCVFVYELTERIKSKDTSVTRVRSSATVIGPRHTTRTIPRSIVITIVYPSEQT